MPSDRTLGSRGRWREAGRSGGCGGGVEERAQPSETFGEVGAGGGQLIEAPHVGAALPPLQRVGAAPDGPLGLVDLAGGQRGQGVVEMGVGLVGLEAGAQPCQGQDPVRVVPGVEDLDGSAETVGVVEEPVGGLDPVASAQVNRPRCARSSGRRSAGRRACGGCVPPRRSTAQRRAPEGSLGRWATPPQRSWCPTAAPSLTSQWCGRAHWLAWPHSRIRESQPAAGTGVKPHNYAEPFPTASGSQNRPALSGNRQSRGIRHLSRDVSSALES